MRKMRRDSIAVSLGVAGAFAPASVHIGLRVERVDAVLAVGIRLRLGRLLLRYRVRLNGSRFRRAPPDVGVVTGERRLRVGGRGKQARKGQRDQVAFHFGLLSY